MIPVRHDDSPLPASPQADVARTDTLYVAATKPFFGKAEAVGRSDGSDGKLLAAATLHVLERDGDVLRVELDGWQPAGVTSVIYARRGKRILSALLDDTAAAGLERGPAQVDADTGAAWTPVKLRAWIDGTDLNISVANLWRYSSALLNGTCAACHSLPEPRQFSANQWVGTLNGMRRYTSLTDDQYRMLLSYVQNHARDTAPPAAAKP